MDSARESPGPGEPRSILRGAVPGAGPCAGGHLRGKWHAVVACQVWVMVTSKAASARSSSTLQAQQMRTQRGTHGTSGAPLRPSQSSCSDYRLILVSVCLVCPSFRAPGLSQHAKDLLTRMNHPDGTCCFCQELLNSSGAPPRTPKAPPPIKAPLKAPLETLLRVAHLKWALRKTARSSTIASRRLPSLA